MTPDELKEIRDMAVANKQMSWSSTPQWIGHDTVLALLAEIDRLREQHARIRDRGQALMDEADRLLAISDDEAAAYVDCAQTWHEMIREVLGDE